MVFHTDAIKRHSVCTCAIYLANQISSGQGLNQGGVWINSILTLRWA